MEIVRFVQQMPPVKTRHTEQVEALQQTTVRRVPSVDHSRLRPKKVAERDRGKDKGPER